MLSTEFLLYLVTVIFVVYVITTYYRDSAEPEIRYKYVHVPSRSESNSNNGSEFKSDNQSRSSDSRIVNHNYNNQSQNQVSGHSHGNGYGFGHGHSHGFGHGHGHGFGHGHGHGLGHPVNIDINNEPEFPPVPPIDPLRKFDYDAVNDDFTPPYRRSYHDEADYRLHPGLAPIYTRGPPGRFRKVGTLSAEGVASSDKYRFLNLMGRKRHYGGNEYEYFASTVQSDEPLKFHIETRGKEITDGDIINIKELEGYTYRFNESKDLSPLYDPFIL